MHKPAGSLRTFSVQDFGAAPNQPTPVTGAIQRAIDAAAVAGGVVTFAPGVYLTGSLFLKSDVELRVDQGVELRAVQDEAAFPDIWTRVAGIEMTWPAALINICDQKRVRITGGGTINGRGEFWWDKFWGPDEKGGMLRDYEARNLRWAVDYDCKRPRLMLVYRSSDVTLHNLVLKRSGFWTVHVCFSDHVTVDGIVIRENLGPSSDGIDIDSSCDILVQNCDVDCNDDALCLKSGRDADGLRVGRPTERVVIRDCVVRTGHGLFTIGSETSGGMRDVEVYNLKAFGTWLGFSFKSARTRGGLVERISIHDIEMVGVPRPFRFTLNWMPTYSYPTLPADFTGEIPAHWKRMLEPVLPPERGLPEFRNISFERIVSRAAAPGEFDRVLSSSVAMHTPDPLASLALDIEAYPEKPMRDIRWNDVRIEAESAGTVRYAAGWKMAGVQIVTPQPSQLELIDCVDFVAPQLRKG
ncbi:glycoside hydrolase family 28 protein [Opitutus sp. ER46]|uniref:glycoside hydrolase family 28 protein n=1 Tax=Opitutus sp. ER46 TaxID=2161864 RepID=UPI000D312B12|nr:glycoside hydrolase family 28 protein [Opitutus sp. ER46]PTX92582.1 endopygalactorunase [Opitutus sp. ER46]